MFVSFANVENRQPRRQPSNFAGPDLPVKRYLDNVPVLGSEGDIKEKSILRSLGESVFFFMHRFDLFEHKSVFYSAWDSSLAVSSPT